MEATGAAQARGSVATVRRRFAEIAERTGADELMRTPPSTTPTHGAAATNWPPTSRRVAAAASYGTSKVLQRHWRDLSVAGRHRHLNPYLAVESFGTTLVEHL
ncbi:hypothetical protein [Streptomyces sp. AC627_RSS907]|uniref:hypothetical protein n=1 Tax=Streptomyces sp. AC627_RSS907 TaxID=2823684 RepID=UPI001C234384|nr:hypothetical protein [Streptomyces sp. AC627_RSS907]